MSQNAWLAPVPFVLITFLGIFFSVPLPFVLVTYSLFHLILTGSR